MMSQQWEQLQCCRGCLSPEEGTGEVSVLYLCHLVLAPETGVVERRVSVLVDRIGVSFALNQLCNKAKYSE